MDNYVILVNIGNRNIKYHGQGFENDEIPKSRFLEVTKYLWENEGEQKNLSLSILPAILGKYPAAYLYMFCTLQEPVFEQDTHFEGLVIERMLKENNSVGNVKAITMRGIQPTSEEKLIPWYKDTIKQIRKEHETAAFIMYDTGGTYQQKAALKAVLEFYFKPAFNSHSSVRHTGLYLYQGIDDQSGGTMIQLIKKTASEQLQQLTNVMFLADHYNYAAASDLLGNTTNPSLSMTLSYAALRWHNMWQEIERKYSLNNFSKAIKQHPVFNTISKDHKKSFDDESLKKVGLGPTAFRHCRNLIAKSSAQAEIGDYSGSILSFHQFIEGFVYGYIQNNSEFKIYDDYRNYSEKLKDWLIENENDSLLERFGRVPGGISFPLLVFYAQKISERKNGNMPHFLIAIQETQSIFRGKMYKSFRFLDTIRNAIAHDGEGVTPAEFQAYFPLVDESFKLFMNEEANPFDQINALLEDLILL
ncbi:hypothetical protein [Flavihumibacter profundi]|uniref:hypothetical protein n=1 Tax=Flavihumibacter profundi TaxID=2716883 RepID=UPI001CC3385A|nr:hypothetical protein [Flavihumibacter profundi]MBZ5857569.1 hypothetical protein [Flavihumibacter profundi]